MGQSTHFAVDTEIVHGVNDAQESGHRFYLLADFGLVEPQFDAMMVKVLLHVLPINIVNVLVGDGQATAPFLVTIGKIVVLGVENTVNKGKVILDLLIPSDMEAIVARRSLRLRDGCFHV